MTASITRTSRAHADFVEITLQHGDSVVMDFTGDAENRAPSPNRESGIRVRIDCAASVGVNGSVALGDALAIDETDRVAAWATRLKFWTRTPLPYGAYPNHKYLRHVRSDDVRRVSDYSDSEAYPEIDLTEGFRRIFKALVVDLRSGYEAIGILRADYAALATGDVVRIDDLDGLSGVSTGTDYYVIKVRELSHNGIDAGEIKLATTAANAVAGTAIDLSGSSTAKPTLRWTVTVDDADALQLHTEQVHSPGVTVEAGSTASRLRLSAAAEQLIFPGWDIEARVGTVDEVRRVSSVDEIRVAHGQTVTGLTYTAATKEFAAASGDDYRVVETQSAVVVTDNGGFVNLADGDAFQVYNPLGNTRSFRLRDDDDADIALTGGTYGCAEITLATGTFRIAAGDAAELASVATGTRFRCANNGGFTGLVAGTDYFLIRLANANTFQLATSKANALAGTEITLSGTGTIANVAFTSGTVGDIVLSQAAHSKAFAVAEPFSGVPATGSDLRIVDGTEIGATTARVETATQATTTVIPLQTFDSTIAAEHDVLIAGGLRDISAVSASAKTITLTTALSAAPEPGEVVEFAHRSNSFFADASITAAAGASSSADATIAHPVSAIRFAGTGSGTNRATIRIAGTWLPEPKERI